MFPARLIASSVPAAQALLGFGSGYFLGGPVSAGVVASVAIIASISVRKATHHRHESAFRQFVLAAILIALHMAALYTIGNDGSTPYLSADAQLVLAGFGLATCAWCAARKRHQLAMIMPPDARSATVDDPDVTIEIEPAARADAASIETTPARRLQSPVALGVVCCALLVVALTFWLGGGDAGAGDSLGGGAVARELPSRDPQPPVPAGATGSADVAAPTAPEVAAAADESAPASGSAVVRDNAVAPSAARRECMAQIESARLFLQIARQSGDPTQYARATETQIARMLGHRPVGPRTLGRIAERMWEQRAAPEKNAAWWSSQFTRCEAARSGGSWYVVRG